MKQFGALLKSKGIGVPFVNSANPATIMADLLKSGGHDIDEAKFEEAAKQFDVPTVVGFDAASGPDVTGLSVLSADQGLVTTGFIKADQVKISEGPIQGLKGLGDWSTIAPAKPPLPEPKDIPVNLALDALLANGLIIKDFIWNHGYDQHPYVNLELGITSKEASKGLYAWISKKGYF